MNSVKIKKIFRSRRIFVLFYFSIYFEQHNYFFVLSRNKSSRIILVFVYIVLNSRILRHRRYSYTVSSATTCICNWYFYASYHEVSVHTLLLFISTNFFVFSTIFPFFFSIFLFGWRSFVNLLICNCLSSHCIAKPTSTFKHINLSNRPEFKLSKNIPYLILLLTLHLFSTLNRLFNSNSGSIHSIFCWTCYGNRIHLDHQNSLLSQWN